MFYDAASTALIASTVYRAALLIDDSSHLANAEKCRQALFALSNSTLGRRDTELPPIAPRHGPDASAAPSSTGPLAGRDSLTKLVHFTDDGWLTPVVNPHQFGIEGNNSAEGEAFVLELQAAYNEWVASTSRGPQVSANSARRTVAGWALVAGCVVIGCLLLYA
ncbi:hypothetical protein B0H14DRAFT_1615308 [Mycena olivaceomarginata]|nr:hypothetical protein B0H14DRAFT_1615308 [Mycena olivaceomarginata]